MGDIIIILGVHYLVARYLNPCDEVSRVARGGQRARAGENLVDRAAVYAT
jgi:hypothetical protein